MNNPGPRKFIAAAVTIFVIFFFILGVYLPLRKSNAYIRAYGERVNSIEQFNKLFNPVLDAYSPIGRDEIVSAYLGIVLNILSQKPPLPKEIVRELVGRAGERSDYFLKKQSGFLFSQNVLKIGAIYKIAVTQFGLHEYYEKAAQILELGVRSSPDRSAFLLNLFELYYFKGDRAGMERVGEMILSRWPEEKS
ncbi:hypothetical protein HY504_03170, partial [Candidatus Wolfebacteria bacterium]|nr:hypothetical protein [Candidatus Wolfebacteria bacterium]